MMLTASALGIGAHEPGICRELFAGKHTRSMNASLNKRPLTDERVSAETLLIQPYWNNMAISSSVRQTNYDWFLDTFCAADRKLAEARGETIQCSPCWQKIDAAIGTRLVGCPYQPISFRIPIWSSNQVQAFLACAGCQTIRGDVFGSGCWKRNWRFNHRQHIDAAAPARFPLHKRALTGGASRNVTVAQLFA